jgi:hypothetical protein
LSRKGKLLNPQTGESGEWVLLGEGRNLAKMGLDELTFEQTLAYLENGEHQKLGEYNV